MIDVATAAAPTTWTTVYTQTFSQGGVRQIDFPAVTARYVKLHVITAVSAGSWGHGVYEFEIYNQIGVEGGGPNLISNSSFEIGTNGGWTAYNSSLSAVTSPTPVDGSYIGQAASRISSDSWVGQHIGNTLTSQKQGVYNVDAWVRSASPGTKNAQVSISVYYGGAWHEFPMYGTINDTVWTEISGVIDVKWSGTLADNDAVFLVRQNSDTTAYNVDKVSMTNTTNVLQNPSFESGTTGWTTWNLTANQASSPAPMDGSYIAQAASRTSVDSWFGQHMASYLSSSGTGTYNISAWVRSSSGTKNATVAISLYYGGAWHETDLYSTINDTGWTLMTGTVNLSWSGNLDDAVFLVSQNNDTTAYYVDDCILSKK